MSDFGTCKGNLDRIKEMMPLTEREEELALMQFDYKSTCELPDEYLKHPVVKKWVKEGKYYAG